MKKSSKKAVSKQHFNGADFERKSTYNAGRSTYYRGDGAYVYRYQDEKGNWKESVIEDFAQMENGREIAIFLDEHDHRSDLDEDADRRRISCKAANQEARVEDEMHDMESVDRDCVEDSLGRKALMSSNPETILFAEEDGEKEQLFEILHAFMEQLKPEQVELLNKFYWEIKTQRDIAAETFKKNGEAMTEPGIYKQKNKALAQLRQMFEAAGITGYPFKK